MTDIVNAGVRSAMMAGIRSKNTRPERLIRSALHRMGFRYRLYGRDIPGKPDIVFRSRNALVFVDGCFWHGHDCCLFKYPSTRPDWWRNKIEGNRQRDAEVNAVLEEAGWRIARVHECALRGRQRRAMEDVVVELATWLNGDGVRLEIRGMAEKGERTHD